MQQDSAVRPAGGEVQLSAYAQRVARRWYVVLLAIVVAVLLVVLNGLGNTRVSEATASVYLGQPTGATGGAETNPRANTTTAVNFLTSQSTIARAAAAAGLTTNQLSGNVAAHPQAAASTTPRAVAGPPIVSITVRGDWNRGKAARAANSLGRQLIAYTNTFQDTKATFLKQKIDGEKRQLQRYQQAADQAQASVRKIAASNLSSIDKLIAQQGYQSTQFNANTRIDTLTTQLGEDQLDLAATRTLESSAFVSPADAHKVSPASHRSLVVIAALAGLVVGVLLALAWDAMRTRTPAAA
jgi:capsular polysaccharide biosynthesis protein